jgi:D-glycerate 3-kinase
VNERQVRDFIGRHRLPERFRALAEAHYLPLASWLPGKRRPDRTFLLGINGAQGTGKSTLADFLRESLESEAGWRVAVLSMDDFYLTRSERAKLGREIHPLLETRGVPGTHDMEMLAASLAELRNLDPVILEGWCVGSRPQPAAALAEPVNALEREEDRSGTWRRYVNEQLGARYADVFAELDALVLLEAPGFDAVYRWRLEQEQKLAAGAPAGSGYVMDAAQVARFIRHYERLTDENLRVLPALADVVLELDREHDCVRSVYRGHAGAIRGEDRCL